MEVAVERAAEVSAGAAAPVAIAVDSAGKTYRTKRGETRALEDLTLPIKSHEFVTVGGPRGCGKRTILRHIAATGKAWGGVRGRKG